MDGAFSALSTLSGFVKGGQVRLLGNNAAQRSSQEPRELFAPQTLESFRI